MSDGATDDTTDEPTPKRRHKTKLKRRIKRVLTRPFLLLVQWVFPLAYCLYMKFVYLTSKVEHLNTDLLWVLRERYGGLIGVMWHQEVVMVAWSFRQYEGHTLASAGDFGDIITRMLEMNGFVVIPAAPAAWAGRERESSPS